MKILGLLLRAATAALLCLIAFAAAAADYPAAKEGDWVARDFRFHTGESCPSCACTTRPSARHRRSRC